MTKEERAAKRAARKAKPSLFAEFKAFISKGNAFMLAVGVVIGGAFSAIVTAFVNILLSVATWPVPGGLKGLVTVLPALNDGQKGLEGIGQAFAKADFDAIALKVGQDAGISEEGAALLYGSNKLNASYTVHGAKYYYNGSAIVDWGSLLTAIISFLIIAIVLFIIVKSVATLNAKKAELQARALEEHYKKHPEERPAPVEPGLPEPTEKDILVQIRDLLKAKK